MTGLRGIWKWPSRNRNFWIGSSRTGVCSGAESSIGFFCGTLAIILILTGRRGVSILVSADLKREISIINTKATAQWKFQITKRKGARCWLQERPLNITTGAMVVPWEPAVDSQEWSSPRRPRRKTRSTGPGLTCPSITSQRLLSEVTRRLWTITICGCRRQFTPTRISKKDSTASIQISISQKWAPRKTKSNRGNLTTNKITICGTKATSKAQCFPMVVTPAIF